MNKLNILFAILLNTCGASMTHQQCLFKFFENPN